MRASAYSIAACTVVVGVTSIVVGDTAAKGLVTAGISPLFAAWARFALAALILGPLLNIGGPRIVWRDLMDWRLILRGACVTFGISCIMIALRTEDLATVFGAFFVGPIVAYILAVVLLGEHVTTLRSVLLAVGFAGVLLVVKPGFAMTTGVGFALLAGASYGGYLTATRWLSGQVRPRVMLISQLCVGAVLLLPFGLTQLPQMGQLSVPVLGLIMLSAAGSAFGNYCLVVASRTLDGSVVAPLIYSQLISATALGYLFFGDWPDAVSLLGLALIFVSGVASFAFAHAKRAG